jgi:hypothetical protein
MTDRLLPAHEALLRWWGPAITTWSVPAAELDRFEERYALTLPSAFRDYLSNSSPVDDFCDDQMTNWWPFGSLKSVAEDYGSPLAEPVARYRDKLILFADFLIWSFGWAVNCTPGADYGKVAVIGYDERFIAESFDEFVSKYIADEASVFA